jgi:AraC-like DNA-binding protein
MREPFKFEERGLCRDFPGKLFIKDERFGEDVRLHYHHSVELNVFRGLSGSIRVEGQTFDLGRVQAAILPPRRLHSYSIKPGGSVVVLHIAPSLLEPLIAAREAEALFGRGAARFFQDSGMAEELEMRLGDTEGGLSPVLLSRTRAAELFFCLAGFYERSGGGRDLALVPGRKGKDQGFVRQLVDLVEGNYQREISLDEAARCAGLSRSRFCLHFREQTGLSFHRFLTEVRLEHARELLGRGFSASAAAVECGFFDCSHFIRHFRRRYGTTPGKLER